MIELLKKFLKIESKISIKESYKYLANKIMRINEKSNANIFGFTSSNNNFDFSSKIKILVHNLSEKGLKVLFIKSEIDDTETNDISVINTPECQKFIKTKNLKPKQFNEIIEENKKNHDIVIISIPSVLTWADSLEYSKICKNVVLMEKYEHSYYSDYENLLLNFKEYDLQPIGVILVK